MRSVELARDYPAATLIDYVPFDIPKFLVDPIPSGLADESFHVVEARAMMA
jgi:hypothetical protein